MLTQRLRHFAFATVASALFTLPLGAQTFTFDAVTCLNHTTGQAVVGSLQNNALSCQGLQTQSGDAIGVVLGGVAGDTSNPNPPPNSPTPSDPEPCQQVSEQEPNDWPEVNELSPLSNGGCLQVSGTIHTGFGNAQQPNPQMDLDDYVVQVTQQGVYPMVLSGQAVAGVYDGRSGEFLMECQGSCTVPSPSDLLIVEVVAQQATDYRLQIASGQSGQGLGATFKVMDHPAPTAYGFAQQIRPY